MNLKKYADRLLVAFVLLFLLSACGSQVGLRRFATEPQPISSQSSGMSVLDDGSIVFRQERLEISLQIIGDQFLNRWVARQRRVYRAGNLQEDREKALLDIPGWRWGLPKVDALATWLKHNGGQRPRDQSSKQIKDQKLLEEHRMFLFLQAQKKAYRQGTSKTKRRNS